MSKSSANPGSVAARVRALAEPLAQGLGLTVWDVRFLKEGVTWYLRLWIDKPGGVFIEDCEALSRALDQPLDEADFIEQSYCLEVCSPGIERDLTREEHFLHYLGSEISLRLIRPRDGVRDFRGTLTAYGGSKLTLRLADGAVLEADRKETAFVRLAEESDGRPEESV
ncbi:MAG: ribosome maturation factor RimP [Oscillospiraceae bacterium]|jgi:ribosome maturation factor RimP|nr:ribosome maturation factor RimP [Oscillospiraceae bacterium]